MQTYKELHVHVTEYFNHCKIEAEVGYPLNRFKPFQVINIRPFSCGDSVVVLCAAGSWRLFR